MQKSETTARDYTALVRRFLSSVGGSVSVQTVRDYLAELSEEYSVNYYKLTLSALKVYFRDYLKQDWLVESFKFPTVPYKPKKVPEKPELQRFYDHLETPRMRAIFLTFASSGLRHSELFGLKLENVDFDRCMLTPDSHRGQTKKTWVTFYNEEAEKCIERYYSTRTDKRQLKSDKLFPISSRDFKSEWKKAVEKSGVYLNRRMLRNWFCCEMGRLGVPDRYVDAFCGRVPKSVLAKHYTSYSPKRLKQIYDKANLKVLA